MKTLFFAVVSPAILVGIAVGLLVFGVTFGFLFAQAGMNAMFSREQS